MTSNGYMARAERLSRLADKWLSLCEQASTLEDMREARVLVGAVCQIENTLKALRHEQRGAQSDDDVPGSAVRKYASAFHNDSVSRTAVAGPRLLDADIYDDPADDDDDGQGTTR